MFISQMKIKCFERNILNARLNQRMISIGPRTLTFQGEIGFFFSLPSKDMNYSSSGESICRLLVTVRISLVFVTSLIISTTENFVKVIMHILHDKLE